MTFRNTLARILTLVALVCSASQALDAQDAKSRALDAALKGYTLTMPKVEAWAKAGVESARALRARKTPPPDPEREAKTIDEMAAQFDAVPEMRRAIRKAGLSTKEYALLGMVIMQVQMFDAIAGADPTAKLPYNMNPANLAFARANKAALAQKFRALQEATVGQ